MGVNATFVYKDRAISIQCSSEDEMSKLLQSFINELGNHSQITDYIFISNGIELDQNSKIANNLGEKKEITIIAHKKLKIIKCPKCLSNDCIVNLKNYKSVFYGCKFGHIDSVIYENYNNIQTDDQKSLMCYSCKETGDKSFFEFYRCFTCSEMFGCPRYFCSKCISKDPKEHIKVKCDEQNYYCREHATKQANKLIKYCFTCKKNLCEECVNSHTQQTKQHIIKNFESMSPNLEELNKSLDEIKKNIDNLQIEIEGIKSCFDRTLKIFTHYYNISRDIVSKYVLFNQKLKNYRILKTLRNLDFSNKQILEDLNGIIKERNIKTKDNLVLDIHNNKIKNLINNTNNINKDEYNEDNDETWLEELNKKEEKKE